MKIERTAALLGQTELFSEVAEDALRKVADKALVRTYKKGQLVFSEADAGDALFVVVEGLLKVFLTSEEGEELVLVTLRPPDVFGELALLDGGPRSASVEALEGSTLIALRRTDFLEVIREDPVMTETLLRSLGRLVRRLTQQASDLIFLDLHGRVAKLLLRFAGEAVGAANDGPVVLDLNLTQTDIASMVGGSRQSVNKVLRAFERKGYVELQGRKILVQRPDLLRARAGL